MDDLDATFYAILEVWEELPRLIGPPYAVTHSHLLKQLELIQSSTEDERDNHVLDLLELLEPFAAARERIAAIRQMTETVRGNSTAIGHVAIFDDKATLYGSALSERLAPPRLVFYTDISAPREMILGERAIVTVSLQPQPESASKVEAEVHLHFGRQVTVYLRALSPDVELSGPSTQTLDLQATENTARPAVFFVRAAETGKKTLELTLMQAGEILYTHQLKIDVKESAPITSACTNAAIEIESRGLDGAPCDLVFRINLVDDGRSTRFLFTLESPITALDAFYQDTAGVVIQGSPREYAEFLFARISELKTKDPRAGSQTVHQRLIAIGEKIFDDLLPDRVKELVNQMDPEKIRTVQIVSDEPYIPWELMRPFGLDPPAFWCEKFAITRWFGGRQPQKSLKVSQVTQFVTSDLAVQRGLLAAAVEAGARVTTFSPAWLRDVEKTLDLDEVPDLWHFDAPPLAANGSGIGIALQNEGFWPLDLNRQRAKRMAERPPVVLMNVAEAGRLTFLGSGLDGWAEVLVKKCRVGCFIAPFGKIDQAISHHFCDTFYLALCSGKTIGEASLEARSAARAMNQEDPTWIVYIAYGHPNARIRFSPPQE